MNKVASSRQVNTSSSTSVRSQLLITSSGLFALSSCFCGLLSAFELELLYFWRQSRHPFYRSVSSSLDGLKPPLVFRDLSQNVFSMIKLC